MPDSWSYSLNYYKSILESRREIIIRGLKVKLNNVRQRITVGFWIYRSE